MAEELFEKIKSEKMLSAEYLRSVGFEYCAFVKIADLSFSEEVRKICASNACGKYNRTWSCPPAIGEYEDCKKKVQSYQNGLVLSSYYEIEDSFDFEGMTEAANDFARNCRLLNEKLSGDRLFLSNKGCLGCPSCTYPTAPCRFPKSVLPSVESYGIWVNKLAETAGMKYIHGPDTVTYFALICF